MFIPSRLLRRLYTSGSLENTAQGVQFSVKHRLEDARQTGLRSVKIDAHEVPRPRVLLCVAGAFGL